MTANYRYLIEDFCKLCGLENSGQIMRGGPVVVDGSMFSLIYSETVNPDIMFIYCDCGDVPLGRQADAYKALLEANLFLYTGTGPSFTVSDETGRVLLVDQYPLRDKSAPEELRNVLSQLAALAKEWRTDHFLEKSASRFRSSSARIPGLNWPS
ncbi:hypothetical protein ASE07_10810 [Noviherbaspirillum sp. Root189]|nr:hypothetical protein ASE07_10810 [Noviherbaspirillum sp. Root189]